MDSFNILTDPVFSAVSRKNWLSFVFTCKPREHLYHISALQKVDVILISQNHRNHIRKKTVIALNTAFPHVQWFCPKGLVTKLKKLGCRNLTTLNWWESKLYEDIEIKCLPTYFKDIRRMIRKKETVSCNWSINGSANLLFCGDTQMHSSLFEEIRNRNQQFHSAVLRVCVQKKAEGKNKSLLLEEALMVHLQLNCLKTIVIHHDVLKLNSKEFQKISKRLVAQSELEFVNLSIISNGATTSLDDFENVSLQSVFD